MEFLYMMMGISWKYLLMENTYPAPFSKYCEAFFSNISNKRTHDKEWSGVKIEEFVENWSDLWDLSLIWNRYLAKASLGQPSNPGDVIRYYVLVSWQIITFCTSKPVCDTRQPVLHIPDKLMGILKQTAPKIFGSKIYGVRHIP